jgi:nucleotide-binding universal stress UspA family protein
MSEPDRARRVVVGVDGSPESVEAVRYAADEAAARGVELLVVHAYAAGPTRDLSTTAASPAAAQRLVDDTLSHVLVGATTPVRTVVAAAPPAALLTSLADEAVLLVLGRHHVDQADGRPSRVVSAVAGSARCPVVVVPGGWSSSVARDAHLGPRAVVVGTTDQMSGTSVLRLAYDEAELRQASVLILHASTAAEPATGLRALSARTTAEFVAGQSLDRPEVAVDYRYVPEETLRALVEVSGRARLMVLGRPRQQSGRLPWGRSVARAMLHQARCPLMVVPLGTRPAPAADRAQVGTPVLVP